MALLRRPPASWRRWPVSLPLHDGRECPDCGATVVGPAAGKRHRRHHEDQREHQRATDVRLNAIADYLGIEFADDYADEDQADENDQPDAA